MSPTGAPSWHRPDDAAAGVPGARDELWAVRVGYCVLVTAAAGIQLMFFWREDDNLLSTIFALVASLIGISYSLSQSRFTAHPISALVLLLYTTTSTSGALLVKSLEWSALSDRLKVPQTTFSVLLATQIVLLLADQVYLRSAGLQSMRRAITRRILLPIGLMRWPSDTELWIFGFVGCFSVMLTGTDFESDASFGMASAGIKLVRAFGFLKFAPFLIPFRDALSGVPSRTRVPQLGLALYFGGLVIISFATNSRSTFADAIPTLGICVLVATALGRFTLKNIPSTRLVLFVLAAAVGAVLLSRVALAMVVVRDYRHNADVGMLVRMTLEALLNDEWLQSAKAKMDVAVIGGGDYSETYVDSRFFARFLLTKFHDNILYYFSLMGDDQIASYKEFMLDRLAATLPDPLLQRIGITINKQDLIVSNGDYIIYIVDGWGLGGFKTGSMIGEVYGVFGAWFTLVMAACTLLLFVVHDAFAVPTAGGRMAFSPMILLLIWNLCGTTAAFGFGAESVTAIPAGIVRGLPQDILIYLLAVALVKGLGRMIPTSKKNEA